VPVLVAVVEERVISEQTAIIGSTEPVRQSTVAAEISRRVEAFYVKAGDFVKKDSIAMTIGYLKGKRAIRIHRGVLKTKGSLFGRSFWARGYCVSTVGLGEHQTREYVREKEKLQKDQDQKEFEFDTDQWRLNEAQRNCRPVLRLVSPFICIRFCLTYRDHHLVFQPVS
jgi:hypothetical protein